MRSPISLKSSDTQWFEIEIPIRWCSLSLRQIQDVYTELNQINLREGDRQIAAIKRPDGKSEQEFATEMDKLKGLAFKLTVSIIGGDDNVTKYGETSAIFDNTDLPSPINTIYFTNETAYKANANGNAPPNWFRLWIHFTKPPLFDPNPLVSHPTVNASLVKIHANDIAYFRATQNVIISKLKRNKQWYVFIHEKFAYDIGLWFIAAPYLLYYVTIYCDKLLPEYGPYSTFRVAFFIYGVGIGLLLYRGLYGYLRWAFPVNVLRENKDGAAKHRIFFGLIIIGLVVNLISHLIGL
jgi:hypothetical protein